MGPAKHAKGDERCVLGGPCHIARPDIGRGRDALLRDPAWHVQKTCNAEKTELEEDYDLATKDEKRGAFKQTKLLLASLRFPTRFYRFAAQRSWFASHLSPLT